MVETGGVYSGLAIHTMLYTNTCIIYFIKRRILDLLDKKYYKFKSAELSVIIEYKIT